MNITKVSSKLYRGIGIALAGVLMVGAGVVFAETVYTTATVLNAIATPLSVGQAGVTWSGYVGGNDGAGGPVQPPQNAPIQLW